MTPGQSEQNEEANVLERFLLQTVVTKALKLLLVSFCLIIVVAFISIIYGFIAHGIFTLRYIFNANFMVGAIITAIGILIMFSPTAIFMAGKNWLEKSAFLERSYDTREYKQQIARMLLWLGMITMVLTGLIQLLLSVIIETT